MNFATTAHSGAAHGDLAANALYRRAVEAAIWGMPLVNFDAMRQAYFRDAGARHNDVMYWSKPANWKYQVATPNNSTNYMMFFVNVKNGPVVVDVPPVDEAALFGTLVDSWNTPLIDVGGAGEDKGKGGKYLLFPPEHEPRHPAGFIPVKSTTYNIYSMLRVIPKSSDADDLDKAITYLKQLKIHPVSGAGSPRPSRFIDMSDKPFEGIAPYDAGFYASLARMVAEEPVKPRDQTFMGLLHTVGIGKDVTFKPDAKTNEILRCAIAEAHAYMAEGWRNAGFIWWPGRTWKFPATEDVVRSGGTFMAGDRVLIDERAFNIFGALGMSRNAPPNLYVETFVDAKGETLNGSCAYRLRVPANVPTTQFWSVVAYDNETAAFIREAPVVGLDSYNPKLARNDDGSVDLYFGPRPPEGHQANWISTAEGRPFFICFRNYAPEKSVLARTSDWALNDVEKIA